MTALIGMLGSAWPAIVGALGLIGGIVWGWLKTQQAKTDKAQAGQRVAEANQAIAEANTQTATVRDAEAQANAAAAVAGVNSVKERANVENDVASLPTGAAAGQLRDDWTSSAGATDSAGGAGKDSDH